MNENEYPSEAIESVAIGPPSEPGRCHAHYRLADGQEGYGYVKRVVPGKPLQAHERLIEVQPPREDGRQSVRELYRPGPACVATKAYRDGWDAVFGKGAN